MADGLAKTARVITSAAAIMICVFGSFVIGDPLRILKVFGLGLAASILIDASLVRLVLVPSVMELLGRSNWYMPRWLDRIVPTLGVEVDVTPPAPTADTSIRSTPDALVAGSGHGAPLRGLRLLGAPARSSANGGPRTPGATDREWRRPSWRG